MIETGIEKSLEQAKNYKIDDSKKLTKLQLRHLCEAESWSYTIAYNLLESIQFAIAKGTCTDVKEIEEFIKNNIDKTNVETKIDVVLGE